MTDVPEEVAAPKKASLSIPIDLNTVLILVLAAAGFWYFNQKSDSAPAPAPTPTPVAKLEKAEAVQLAATCDVLSIAVATDGVFKTTRDVGECWSYVDKFSFGGVELSPAARTWVRDAEVRVQRALGQEGATAARPLTSQDRLRAAQEFKSLAEELKNL